MRPPIPFLQVQRALQSGLPTVVLGTIVIVAGAAAIALSWLRSRDRLLRWFGIFTVLYGLRLWISDSLVGVALGIERPVLIAADRIITYAIPIPYALFFREWFGAGWRKWIGIWLWAQIIFAPAAIVVALIAGYPALPDRLNNILVLAGTPFALAGICG